METPHGHTQLPNIRYESRWTDYEITSDGGGDNVGTYNNK